MKNLVANRMAEENWDQGGVPMSRIKHRGVRASEIAFAVTMLVACLAAFAVGI